MSWQEEYKRKLVSADEAAKLVKSGDRVEISIYPTPTAIPAALAKRRGDLRNVETVAPEPTYPLPWYQPGWEDSFQATLELHVGMGGARPLMDEKRGDYYPILFSLWHKPQWERSDGPPIDVFACVVSPPDKNGLCSFGGHLWNKRILCQQAKIVLAEVDPTFVRTYGTNYIHMSRIERFVESLPHVMSDQEMETLISSAQGPGTQEALREVARRLEPARRDDFLPRLAALEGTEIRRWAEVYGYQAEPSQEVKAIASYVSEIIEDGDTFQIGGGTPSTLLIGAGAFDNKHDLGVHSEMAARGLVDLVRRGIVTGRKKNFHTGKVVLSALTACTQEEIRWAHNNPLIELYDSHYVVNIANVSRNDHMVSINSALSIDLTGQINAETVFGGRLIAGTGGQPELHMGALSARWGKAITCLRSTALGGAVSRIVPQHEAGTAVTVTRGYADYVVTEYGVARLFGKTFRQRAEELIAVAHPDFRAELRKEAQRLFYP